MIMDQSSVDRHLKCIERIVIDEGKIVTYKGLSRSLGININTAKQLLHTFVSSSGKNYGDKLSSTYQVSGKKDDGSLFVSVIRETDLPSIRASLVDIFSEHVYSVQTGNSLLDLQLLYAVDTPEEMSALSSPITCIDSVADDGNNLQLVKVPEAVFVKTEKETKPAKKPVQPVFKKEENKTIEETIKDVTNKVTNVKIEPSKGKPTGTKTNSISSMFSAQSSKPKKIEKIDDKPKTNDEVKIVEEKNTKIELKKEPLKTKKVSKKSEKTNKRKNKGDAVEDGNEKKRKRIRVFSDSEDSDADELEREKSPSPEPPEPEPELKIESEEETEKEPIGSSDCGAAGPVHKRKKRKIVDKLVMTDEGYMETTKEVVFETDSEPDVAVEKTVEKKKSEAKSIEKVSPQVKNIEKVSPVKNSNKKKISPKQSASPKKGKGKAASNDGRKQATLLSFFKKT